jgi:UV DNA damage endonuclease
LKTIEAKGLEYVKCLSIKNIEDTKLILYENQRLGIHAFRISSDVFPHVTNPKLGGYNIDYAIPKLKELGKIARQCNQRLTAHPGQFNVLSSPNEKVVENTLSELNFQAQMFDIMGMGPDSTMTIHFGGIYNDKQGSIQRWIANFGRLSTSAQHRLAIENCEKCFNIADCIDLAWAIKEKYGFYLPIIVDSHHFVCYNQLHPNESINNIDELMPCVIETWLERGIRMKVHISEQGSGKIGHHSDFIEKIPRYFLDIYDIYGVPVDLYIEAKAKEEAILNLARIYPNIFKPN